MFVCGEGRFRVRRRGENLRFAVGAAAHAKAGRTNGDRSGNMGNGRGLRKKSRRAHRNRARCAICRADGFVVARQR
ncbi:MAG: hypothetical protein IJG84_02730 [Kiritimatiellae bacterium]|nr:hypothetical protein [Kiritimatiellia bacterium]